MLPLTSTSVFGSHGANRLNIVDYSPYGIGQYPASPLGEAYPCIVSAVDTDGNELAGVRMPDVEVPVATHTGWNPRHTCTGVPELILEYVGSTVPFPKTPDGADDSRPNMQMRYENRQDYLRAIRAAARRLVTSRHLVEEDSETCVAIASVRYDAMVLLNG